MDDLSDSAQPSFLDRSVGKDLQKRFANLTRRSFLSVATRKIISLTGVGVAAQMFPYLAQEAYALDAAECGLHGYHCGGNCIGGSVGISWVQCCQMPIQAPNCPTVFVCCNYTDYCGTRGPNWGVSCGGVTPSGTQWCGATPGKYICTAMSCTGNYQSESACTQVCQTGGGNCAY